MDPTRAIESIRSVDKSRNRCSVEASQNGRCRAMMASALLVVLAAGSVHAASASVVRSAIKVRPNGGLPVPAPTTANVKGVLNEFETFQVVVLGEKNGLR